jgi:hypothetical protein
MHAACPNHPVLFDLMTLMFGFVSSQLHPNITTKPTSTTQNIRLQFVSFNLNVFQQQMGKQNILSQKAAIIPQI